MFRGRSVHTLDAKGRIRIPTRFRDILKARYGDRLEECNQAVFEVRVGVPFVEIVRYAREHNVDFIVMGASGSSELDKQTFGSTVENVARRAHCHVMAIRNPELAFKLPG